MKLIIFLVITSQLLTASFLEMDRTKLVKIKNMFGSKAVKRLEYIQDEFIKIGEESFTYSKIYRINSLINKLIYKKDIVHWKDDYRPTFLEFITSGAGDSLDFATAKYISLVNLGFDPNKFKFFKTNTQGISRTKYDLENYYVLGYAPKSSDKYVILDCYTNKIMPAFREGIELKKSDISANDIDKMFNEMLHINFKHKHNFLPVATQ